MNDCEQIILEELRAMKKDVQSLLLDVNTLKTKSLMYGAGWANVNDLSSITNAINSITNTLATLKVTVSGMTPYALTQIVGAGNAAGWSVNGGSFTLGASSGLNIDFQLSKNYIPVSGATVNILIKRDTDNYYYNGSGWINTVPTPTLVTTEYDASRFPGLYRYTLSPNFAGNIFASVNYTESGIVYSENGVWTIVEDDSAEMASNIITIGNDVSGLISTTSNIDTNVSGLITTTNSIKTKIDRINVNSSGNIGVSVSGVVIPTSRYTKIRYV